MAMNAGGRGIRLRPLDIGDVLDETFQVYRRGFVPLITTMAIVLVPMSLVLLVVSVVTGLGFGMGQSMFDQLSPEAAMALIGAGSPRWPSSSGWPSLSLACPVDRKRSRHSRHREHHPRAADQHPRCVPRGARPLRKHDAGQPLHRHPAGAADHHLSSASRSPSSSGWAGRWRSRPSCLKGGERIESMRRSWDLVDGHRWRLLVVFMLLIGLIEWMLVEHPERPLRHVRGRRDLPERRQPDRPVGHADRPRWSSRRPARSCSRRSASSPRR